MLSYLSKNSVNPFRFKSIKAKLLFWFLVMGMLPLIIGITITWNQQIRSIKKESISKLVAIRNLKTRQVEAWLDTRIADIKTASCDNELVQLENLLLKKKKDPEDMESLQNIRRMLIRFVENYGAYEELLILNPRTGNVEISTSHYTRHIDNSRETYFTQPMTTRKLFIKDIHESKLSGKKTLTFSMPIFCAKHNQEHIVGIMVASIDLKNSLYSLLGDRVGLGRTGESLIINGDSLALSELRWHEDAPLDLKILATPARNASQGKSGVIESLDYRGEAVLASYSHIPKVGWGLVVKQDLAELHAPIRELMTNFILLGLGVLMAIFIIAIVTARAIATPIIEMAATATKIKQGDLSARNHIFSGPNELVTLSETVNAMAVALESQVALRQINDGITRVMVDSRDLETFRFDILKKLITVTDSQMGVYFLLNQKTRQYEAFASIGIMAERLKPFDADSLEGETGWLINEGKISFLKDIPQDNLFQFRTFTGTLPPREIISIPLSINDTVVGIISLASVKPYGSQATAVMEQPWTTGLSTALSNMIANAETARLAAELQSSNQELQAQAEEMALQARELQQTTEELQQQNQALEIQREKVQEANRLKNEFLSNMSHELRTPLNSVMALSRVLLMQTKDTLSAEELNYLEIIERNGKNLLSLINDILDLAKIESGKMEVISRHIHIEETIENIMERLEPLAREKGIKIEENIDRDLPAITCDGNRLHQVLQNIMGNAVKFTSRGGVTVSAWHDRNTIYVRVSDTGIGIAPKELPHIFEEFRQVDGTASRSYEGTGLGLAIAYKTAQLLGGDISVESTLGKGSIFTFHFPVHTNDTPEPPQVSPRPRVQKQDFPTLKSTPPCYRLSPENNTKRLLVVEDNESAVIQIKMILEKAGYHVDIATSGQQALNYIAGTIPDGIILDLMMPGIDGFEVLEKMRNTRATAGIPVLILTARDLTPEDLNKLTSNNVQQLVQKGDIDVQGLLGKIKSMLGEPKEEASKDVISPDLGQPSVPLGKASQAMILPNMKKQKHLREKPTVLIVEDNLDNMITLKAILGTQYAIQEAANGKQGLDLALTALPDLILLDISLPEMDGYGVVEVLKKQDLTRHIPVIALTAHAMKGDRQKIMDAGCDDYISKPVDPETLMPRIEKWMNYAQNISN
ncbi:response regulator [Desulfocicer niacini]